MTNLEAARKNVNAHKFGTPEWEAAMVIVRQLVEQATTVEPMTSVDGDVWSVG